MARAIPGIYQAASPPAAAPVLATGVPMFVGYSASPALHPSDAPRMVTDPSQLSETAVDPYLAFAVHGFFACGGERCYVSLIDRSVGFSHGAPATDVWKLHLLAVVPGLVAIDLVCLPSVMCDPYTCRPVSGADTAVLAIQREVLVRCAARTDCIAILDGLPSLQARVSPDGLAAQVAALAQPDGDHNVARNGALYVPWLRPDGDTAVLGDWRFVPTSGHIAGIYASNDASLGVEAPPANRTVAGALDVACAISEVAESLLDPRGNILRVLPMRGVVVWGARTLDPDPPWRYIGVRRLIALLDRWLHIATEWAVFEPNDLSTWLQIDRQLTGYLTALFERGVLRGRSAGEAFYVKCDRENNPPDQSGTLVVEVGVAPATPAEWIVLRLTRTATDVAVTAAA